MRHYLGLDEIPLQLHTPIILVNIFERLVGLIVDQVLTVMVRPGEQIIDPNSILIQGMGEIPQLQGLIQSQDGSILLLNLEQLFKSFQIHALLDAVDNLNQGLDQNGSARLDVSQLIEIPPPAENAKIDAHDDLDLQPAKQSKKRSRKRGHAKPETTNEVAL
jgi:hypothetical protein